MIEKADKDNLSEEEANEQASVDFGTGFAKVAGTEVPESAEPESTPDDDPPAASNDDKSTESASTDANEVTSDKQGNDVEEEDDDWGGIPASLRKRIEPLTALETRLHRVETRVGRINSTVEKQLAAAGAADKAAAEKGTASPSQDEIDAALDSPEKWKELKEAYGEWVEDFEKLLTAQEKRLSSQIPTDYVSKTEVNNYVESRLDERELNRAHPDWEQSINSQDYQDWFFDEGPPKSDWPKFQQATPEEGEKMLDDWIKAHPVWWEQKGKLFLSDKIGDQITILDNYKKAAKAAQDAAAAKDDLPGDTNHRQDKNKADKRLRAAVTPKSSGQPPQTGVDDKEAFKSGFNKIRGASVNR